MPVTTTRQARPDDMDRIYEIVAAAFGPFCMAKLMEDRFGIVDGKTWVEHKAGSVVQACKMHLDYVIVAEEEGRVVGFASSGREGNTGMVGNNAVDPDCQGRGLGTMLIRDVLRRLKDKGVTRFRVSTMEHDHPARRVYEKWGFRERGRSAMYARPEGQELEQVRTDATDTAERARLEAEGFILIAQSVHYDMTLGDLTRAEARLSRS